MFCRSHLPDGASGRYVVRKLAWRTTTFDRNLRQAASVAVLHETVREPAHPTDKTNLAMVTQRRRLRRPAAPFKRSAASCKLMAQTPPIHRGEGHGDAFKALPEVPIRWCVMSLHGCWVISPPYCAVAWEMGSLFTICPTADDEFTIDPRTGQAGHYRAYRNAHHFGNPA